MVSIIIPCYNQGRFLIDCLESLAWQTVLPQEVVVVNDGSTDQVTSALCARLPYYHYPFSLEVLQQANRGLPAARNAGIQRTCGEIIVLLDSDDTLLPTALECYERFLRRHPDVDVCYPDMMLHGSWREDFICPRYNVWRHTQHNWIATSAAIRRRVFEAGYWFCEEMTQGFEDWEFFLRAGTLGPFTLAALEQRIFAYRRWGCSMMSVVDELGRREEISRRHTALGLWSATRAWELRTQHAPAHGWVRPSKSASASLPSTSPVSEAQEDLFIQPLDQLEAIFRDNHQARFIWLGDLPTQDPAAFRFLLGGLATEKQAILYAFYQASDQEPYLLVFDRLAELEVPGVCKASEPSIRAVLVETQGDRFPYPVSVRFEPSWPLPMGGLFAHYRALPSSALLPPGYQQDLRLRGDMFYYFRRDCLEAAFVHLPERTRTLTVALSQLSEDAVSERTGALLASPALRQQFDRIEVLVFASGPHPAHARFEPLVDGIYHLGPLGLSQEEEQAFFCQLLENTRSREVLIVNSPQALHAIPVIRKAGLSVRFSALMPALGEVEALPSAGSALRILATHYSTLVDRVLVGDHATASLLSQILYFPEERLQVDDDEDHSDAGVLPAVPWLFPEGRSRSIGGDAGIPPAPWSSRAR
jgi:hypothetical protein